MRGFQRTISRGPDASKVVDTGEGYLGFHRLAIMGMTTSGMQPFQLDDSHVVCNGEIYGFEKWKEELKEKYVFKSESDCEVLLPLYQEYGVEMFAMPVSYTHLDVYKRQMNNLYSLQVCKKDRHLPDNRPL